MARSSLSFWQSQKCLWSTFICENSPSGAEFWLLFLLGTLSPPPPSLTEFQTPPTASDTPPLGAVRPWAAYHSHPDACSTFSYLFKNNRNTRPEGTGSTGQSPRRGCLGTDEGLLPDRECRHSGRAQELSGHTPLCGAAAWPGVWVLPESYAEILTPSVQRFGGRAVRVGGGTSLVAQLSHGFVGSHNLIVRLTLSCLWCQTGVKLRAPVWFSRVPFPYKTLTVCLY